MKQPFAARASSSRSESSLPHASTTDLLIILAAPRKAIVFFFSELLAGLCLSQHTRCSKRRIEDRRTATKQCRLSRHTLREADKAVASVGKMVNLDAADMATLQLPDGRSDDELLAYSRALLERVSDHADAFVAEGLPPDLLKHLGDGVAAFAAARDAQAVARQRFSAAFDSIRDTLDHADMTVDVLEAIAINTPGAPPEVLTKLRIARRVGPRVIAPPKAPPSTPTGKAA